MRNAMGPSSKGKADLGVLMQQIWYGNNVLRWMIV